MNIVVRCHRPSYARGEFTFTRFEELHNWLLTINSLAQVQAGLWLYGLAQDGEVTRTPSGRVDLEIECSYHDPILAREVAITTGLVRIRGLSEIMSKDPDEALAFARQLDGRIPITTA